MWVFMKTDGVEIRRYTKKGRTRRYVAQEDFSLVYDSIIHLVKLFTLTYTAFPCSDV